MLEVIILYNILIVEDDLVLSKGITLALKQEDYEFTCTNTIKEARCLVNKNKYDLIILDINLPDGDGIDFLIDIRKSFSMPVIMLTANDLETDIVTGLEMGADDYITKPFSLMILRARVNAQLRKSVDSNSQIILIDNFKFCFEKMEFYNNGQVIELSKTEQKLLKILVENKGNTLTRATLVDRIWTDGAEYVDENALSVAIKRLRDKLEDKPPSPKYIKTVYGIGYTWAVK